MHRVGDPKKQRVQESCVVRPGADWKTIKTHLDHYRKLLDQLLKHTVGVGPKLKFTTTIFTSSG